MGKQVLNLIGKKYGKLTVVSRSDNDKDGRSTWNCKCECGLFKVVSSKKLTRKDTKPTFSCGCLKDRNARLLRDMFPSISKEESLRIRSAWSGAKRLGPIELSFIDFAAHCFALCSYCGLESPKKMGIDRVDSKKGYSLDNITPACKRCNQAKNDMSVKEFIELIRKIAETTKHWAV